MAAWERFSREGLAWYGALGHSCTLLRSQGWPGLLLSTRHWRSGRGWSHHWGRTLFPGRVLPLLLPQATRNTCLKRVALNVSADRDRQGTSLLGICLLPCISATHNPPCLLPEFLRDALTTEGKNFSSSVPRVPFMLTFLFFFFFYTIP